jgi:hypothetical protein
MVNFVDYKIAPLEQRFKIVIPKVGHRYVISFYTRA